MENAGEKFKNRAFELDLLRGIAVVMMMFDHFMNAMGDIIPYMFPTFPRDGTFWVDVVQLCKDYWYWDVRVVFHYIFCFVFLGLTGICCSFSKNNLKRGLKLLGVAMAFTVASYIVGYIISDRNITVTFGVLHCIALSLIVIGAIEKFCDNKWVLLVIGVCMVAVGIYMETIAEPVSYAPESLPFGQKIVEYIKIVFAQIIGTKHAGGDCFPWLFNGGQVFIGAFLGKLLYKEKKSLFGWKYHNNFVSFCGRYSLIVFFAHQVIIPVVIGIILMMFGHKLVF